ncbi:peptide deformylase [Streptomyces sp. SLBN-8D4]
MHNPRTGRASQVRHVGHLVNPVLDRLAPAGRRLLDDGEGCLPVPGAVMAVSRRAADVEALNGAQGTVSASGSGPVPTPTPRRG